jgi:hypothetical protein
MRHQRKILDATRFRPSAAPAIPAFRNLRRRQPGNRHAELLILCARIGFNP